MIQQFTGRLGTTNSFLGNLELGTSQAGVPVAYANISESLVLTETLARIIKVHKNINEDLDLVEIAFGRRPIKYLEATDEELYFYETVARTSIRHRNISESLTLSEIPYVRVPETRTFNISEALTFTETKGVNTHYDVSISESLVFVEAKVRGHSSLLHKIETLSFLERIGVNKAKPHNKSESLVLTETLIYRKWIPLTTHEKLTFTETNIRVATLSRTVTDHLPLRGGASRLTRLSNLKYSINEVEAVRRRKRQFFVALECSLTNTSILLPSADLGDTEKNLNTMVSKRSMTNVLYTYIRRNELQQLTYDFTLGRFMALALEEFIATNVGNVLTMANWKGELWKVNLTNNPFDFVGKSKFLNEGEKWIVTLEFQGIKILG